MRIMDLVNNLDCDDETKRLIISNAEALSRKCGDLLTRNAELAADVDYYRSQLADSLSTIDELREEIEDLIADASDEFDDGINNTFSLN